MTTLVDDWHARNDAIRRARCSLTKALPRDPVLAYSRSKMYEPSWPYVELACAMDNGLLQHGRRKVG